MTYCKWEIYDFDNHKYVTYDESSIRVTHQTHGSDVHEAHKKALVELHLKPNEKLVLQSQKTIT